MDSINGGWEVRLWVRRIKSLAAALNYRCVSGAAQYESKLTVPVLIMHGRDDSVVLPAMSEHIAATLPGVQTSFYDGAGHEPFVENPKRFNSALAAFAARATAG